VKWYQREPLKTHKKPVNHRDTEKVKGEKTGDAFRFPRFSLCLCSSWFLEVPQRYWRVRFAKNPFAFIARGGRRKKIEAIHTDICQSNSTAHNTAWIASLRLQ
jgi:hypothetical protein